MQKPMQKFKTISAAALLIVAMGLNGCALYPHCSPENCASDKLINAEVNQIFSDHPEFGPPGTVHVQTTNGVVYLSGAVDSDFEARRAEALARQVANVKDVQNNLYARSNGR
jgi:osmotically-inducible protein OsmY